MARRGTQGTDSSCGEQVGQSDQIVGARLQLEHPGHTSETAELGLCHAAHALDPAIGFLDPLANNLAHLVAAVAGGAAIDGGTAAPVEVLRHMRGGVQLARGGHEAGGVIRLVGADSDPVAARHIAQHRQGSLGSAVPLARVSRASTTSPLRFSISRCPV